MRTYALFLLFLPLLCWAGDNQASYDIRLPEDVIPTYYRLLILPFLKGNCIFEGSVKIDIKVQKETPRIVLHSKDLEIYKNKTRIVHIPNPVKTDNENEDEDLDGQKVDVVDHEENAEHELLILHLSVPLIVGNRYRLRIDFSGNLSDNFNGFYKIPYRSKNSSEVKYIAATTFEPANARRAFPCFDEPGFKARFKIDILRHNSTKTLSNMPLKESVNAWIFPDMWIDRYEETPVMPTYLVAWVIGDLEYREVTTTNGRPVRVYARQDLLHQADYALSLAPRMISTLERYLGLEDPIPKTDMVALPKFISEALENWGLISFRERNLLISANESTPRRIMSASVIAHELSHIWFGNLITIKWWDSIWLNEGMATYFSTIAVQEVEPDFEIDSRTAVTSFMDVFSADGIRSSHPLTVNATNTSELSRIFNKITYYKGYYMMRMVNYTLGEASFRAAIRRYVSKYQQGSVQEDDFWSILTEQAREDDIKLPKGVDFKRLFGPWTTQAGFPVVSVLRNYSSNSVTITQKRFLRYKNEGVDTSKVDGNKRWWIPLTFISQTERLSEVSTRPRVWLNPKLKKVHLQDAPGKDTWLLFNLYAAGLYRVNYDVHNWLLLTNYLDSDEYQNIPVVNRALLLDDALDLARAEILPFTVAFNLTRYLSRETHFLPWTVGVNHLDFFMRMSRTSEIENPFKKFLIQMVAGEFKRLGIHSKSDEKPATKLHRKLIVQWACSIDFQDCVDDAITLFKTWQSINGSSNPIPVDVQSAVYCTAIRHGTQEDWEFLWNVFKQSKSSLEQSRMLEGLGCANNSDILKRFLSWSVKEDSRTRKQYRRAVFEAVAKNPVGSSVATTFLKENPKIIEKDFGLNPFELPKFLAALVSSINQPKQLDELRTFRSQNEDRLRSASQALDEMTEMVEANINWVKRNRQAITNWLKEMSFRE